MVDFEWLTITTKGIYCHSTHVAFMPMIRVTEHKPFRKVQNQSFPIFAVTFKFIYRNGY